MSILNILFSEFLLTGHPCGTSTYFKLDTTATPSGTPFQQLPLARISHYPTSNNVDPFCLTSNFLHL